MPEADQCQEISKVWNDKKLLFLFCQLSSQKVGADNSKFGISLEGFFDTEVSTCICCFSVQFRPLTIGNRVSNHIVRVSSTKEVGGLGWLK